jgi:hypothetical protein
MLQINYLSFLISHFSPLTSLLSSLTSHLSLLTSHLSSLPRFHQHPLPHILNILPNQLIHPGNRFISPALRVESHHYLIGKLSFFSSIDDIESAVESWKKHRALSVERREFSVERFACCQLPFAFPIAIGSLIPYTYRISIPSPTCICKIKHLIIIHIKIGSPVIPKS